MIIRVEEERDRVGVRAVHEAAFPSAAEANLVDALRAVARPLVSLVAESAGEIAGHIMFSPVRLGDHAEIAIMGLAPMAVVPSLQRRGVGSSLVRAGLTACRDLAVEAVVVLGHPQYYPRFGFVPSVRFGVGSEYDVAEEVFMVVELRAGVLSDASGTIRYHDAFKDL